MFVVNIWNCWFMLIILFFFGEVGVVVSFLLGVLIYFSFFGIEGGFWFFDRVS